MSARRMLPFILINIVVSAAVVLSILYYWDNRREASEPPAAPAAAADVAPTAAATPVSAAVENTPEAAEEEGPLTHVVKAGETLGVISQFYEVALDDIMQANGISDPNRISAGQELIIPVGGLLEPTPLPTSEPTAAVNPTPIPTEEPAGQGEAIVEITAVTGAGNLADEAVQISNRGGRQIALKGWKLADANGHVYTFGQVTLFGDGAAIQVHSSKGLDGPVDLFWGLESPVLLAGERITLLDAEGAIQSTFDIP